MSTSGNKIFLQSFAAGIQRVEYFFASSPSFVHWGWLVQYSRSSIVVEIINIMFEMSLF